ncbi:MAG TPA: RidA family protein [Actinomycetota bacterium]|nr:RidA family protein [Actinomycetota bacterium]
MDWSKRAVDVPELFESRTRAYEHCVVAGPLIFVAGEVGWKKEEGVISLEFEPQVRKTFENIQLALRAAGADLKDLVAMTVYLTDPRYMDEFLELRKEILDGNYATSTMITVDKLYDPKMLIEISAIAVRPPS